MHIRIKIPFLLRDHNWCALIFHSSSHSWGVYFRALVLLHLCIQLIHWWISVKYLHDVWGLVVICSQLSDENALHPDNMGAWLLIGTAAIVTVSCNLITDGGPYLSSYRSFPAIWWLSVTLQMACGQHFTNVCTCAAHSKHPVVYCTMHNP